MGTTNLDSLTLSGTLTAASIVGPVTGAIAATTVSASGQITGAAGTVSLPEYSFTADPDCGIYRINANNLGIAVNAAKVLDIATTGLAVTGALSATTTITATTSIDGPVGATTPAAGIFTQCTTTAFFDETAVDALTAVGTNRGNALALTKARNRLTTAATGTGVVLPASATVGVGGHVIVYNAGAQPVQVYAAGSDTIDGVAGSTGVPLTNAKRCEYFVMASGTFISAQLGVISA